MSATKGSRSANALIASLPPPERNRFAGQCDRVELVPGEILCELDEPCPLAYFPVSGVISVAALVSHRPAFELGLIGHDGMLGSTLSLDTLVAPLCGIVQGAGSALVMSAAQLCIEMRASPRLLRIMHRYQFRLLMQIVQTATCTHFHEIEARLARWLLMTHDLSAGDSVHCTHEFLAQSLGVRRSGVTIAAGALQHQGFIRYARGNIQILDRNGLEAAACECYRALIDRQQRVFA